MTSQIVSASSLFFAPFNPNIYSNKLVFSMTPQIPKIQFIPQFNVNTHGLIDLSKRPTKIIEQRDIITEIQPLVSELITEQKEILPLIEKPQTTKTILITHEGFKPQTLNIHQGETVQWINKRPQTKSLVYGVRSLSNMRSPMLEQDQTFTWDFNSKGTFVYVDSVVIGRIGKIIVE
ncbi:hypothetical protein HQ489_02730 [Candidatus Woesearchaeota archaeon]|nr:hypothetical protein [Candidatus Woesearchaeota archaeon]